MLTKLLQEHPVLTRRDFQGLCGLYPYQLPHANQRLKRRRRVEEYHTYYNPIYVPMPGYYGKAEMKTDE
ncbi:hypothetical protein [Bacteroides xylanisolvens]|uniref:hypothetical protein n=1 Tax=Bacteroides xylanisolvens TaxID=371601 RepID=UPI001CE4A852|nr:hypothetical protein [Bacteroides xylanisolvens]